MRMHWDPTNGKHAGMCQENSRLLFTVQPQNRPWVYQVLTEVISQVSLSFQAETVQQWLPPANNPLLLRPQSVNISSKRS